ncbi:DJ-1/PfpI family protein [Aquimarina gracilis]|uniref:DJ-1/PfpI family protein n=1 Tax=Aquimarina gracilis TaxID=874422 RepID=A0ABU5ZZ36_9FLAO|nr:DJ-1/PfpI family protein [Aquimarina gracilis]MEB3347088.1 DJ-1/PfpI family protein [Aquimarina gracilis]
MKKVSLLMFIVLFQFSIYGQNKSDIKNIAIYLQDNVEILDFTGPMEVFIVAGFNVYTVAETKEHMKSMNVLTIIPDYGLDDANIPTPDIITFVGGGDLSEAKNKKVKEWAKNMASAAEIQFSVCTGAFFLAEAGLLNGKIATTFHSAIDLLSNDFPEIDVRDNVRFVDNGNVITTAGISAGIDGALHVVAKLKGTKYAQWVASQMEYEKWIPNEGLIVENTFLNTIAYKGFDTAIKNINEYSFYNGELLNLANKLEKKGNLQEAQKCIELAISRMENPSIKTYDNLRSVFKKQGKTVPPTSDHFVMILKNKGIDGVKELHHKVSREFKGWKYLDADQIIRVAYLDYYQKGDIETAKETLHLLDQIYPKDAYVTYVLGLYYERSNDLPNAIKLYKKSLKMNPNLFMAQNKINSLKKEGKI